LRVRPSLGTGLLILVGYLVVVFSMWIVTGLDYDEIGDTVDGVREGITFPVGLGAIYLVVVTSVLGWWKPAIHEPRRAGHGWMWAIPGLLLLGAVGNLASTEWGRIDQLGTYVLWLALGCAFVGFSEELATRGLLIVGARGTVHERLVWFISSLCFGLLHVPNVFFGQGGRDTVQQVVFAFLVGTTYYVTRRIGGTLITTMALHGLWDFSTFVQAHSVDGMADKTPAVGGTLMYPAIILGLLAVWRILHSEGDVVEPGGDQAAALAGA
jgi:hypothetical protein